MNATRMNDNAVLLRCVLMDVLSCDASGSEWRGSLLGKRSMGKGPRSELPAVIRYAATWHDVMFRYPVMEYDDTIYCNMMKYDMA